MAEADNLPAPMNPPRSQTARQKESRHPIPRPQPHRLASRFHNQIGSAQYRKEIDAISFAINPSSCHEGAHDTPESIVDPAEPERLCYRFEEDLRLADDVDLEDVTAWVREYVGCRLCIARVRNAVRIHAAYKWYEVRQRVNVAMKDTAVMEGKRLASPEWREENVDKFSAWMKESAEISEIMSS